MNKYTEYITAIDLSWGSNTYTVTANWDEIEGIWFGWNFL